MTRDHFDKEQLLDLIGGLLDGWLDAPGRKELAAMLMAHPEAREIYCRQADLHARLHLDYAGGLATEFMRELRARPRRRRFPVKQWAWAAVAACLAFGVFFAWPRPVAPDSFATLANTQGARWENSDLPTTEGSRVGKGTLNLAEGMATFRFDSGAELTVEAPARLTLHDAMHCTLTGGGAVMDVPDSAKGFRITTPTAEVTDFGTRFSVIVDQASGNTQTQVYEGLVEVEQLETGKMTSLKAGQVTWAGRDKSGRDPEHAEDSGPESPIGPPVRSPDWTLLQTSKDAYIGRAYLKKGARRVKEVHRSESLLLLKNGTVDRKAYLGFDLSGLDAERIADAELSMQFEPTGWGLASLVPDATFVVYGLLGEESWNEQSIDERNAPASKMPGGRKSDNIMLIPDQVSRLGSFEIKQGVQRGEFGINGHALVEFLRERAGTVVTLIVVRETPELETNGLVHGFASRRHPTLRPPTLAIRLKDS